MNKSPCFQEYTSIATQFDNEAKLILNCGKVEDFLLTIPDKSIALIVTSPPYNLGKEYEKRLAIENYL